VALTTVSSASSDYRLACGREWLKAKPPAEEETTWAGSLPLGPVLFATAGYAAPAVAVAHQRARQLCEELDRPHDLAVLVSGQCVYHVLAGELTLAVEESDAVLQLAHTRHDLQLEFLGYSVSTIAWFHIGGFTTANKDAACALKLYDPAS
jgi:hypothetical protein